MNNLRIGGLLCFFTILAANGLSSAVSGNGATREKNTELRTQMQAAGAVDSYAQNVKRSGAALAPGSTLSDSEAAAYFATYVLLHHTRSESARAQVTGRAAACRE